MAEKSTIQPPKSVLIQAGREPEEDIDTQPIQDSDKKTEHSDAVQNYLRIRTLKPKKGLTALGAIFLLIPFLLVLSGGDVFDLGAICCISFLIGIILIVMNSSQTSNWNKEMKAARKRVEFTEKIPYIPAPQWPAAASLFFAVGGLLAMDFDSFLFFPALLLAMIFSLYYYRRISQQDKVYNQLIDQFVRPHRKP